MEPAISYVCGGSSAPLRYETVGGVLERAAERWPDGEALVVRHQGRRLSFRELNALSDRVAAGLLALGLEPGDRIGIWASNCVEWVLTQFGSAKAGLILVNINPAYRIGELEFALTKVGCRALVLAPRFKTSDYTQMMIEAVPELLSSAPGRLRAQRLPALQWLIRLGAEPAPGFLGFDALLECADPEARERLSALRVRLQPDDPVIQRKGESFRTAVATRTGTRVPSLRSNSFS